jgi:AcrR family transcriptional regulator
VEAAFDLLGTDGWSGTTVRAVCQGARLNPRYFYESFDDLDSLVVAVYDHVVAEMRDAVLAAQAAAPADSPAQARAAVETIVGFVDDDRRRARILYVEALGNEALNRRRVETGHAVIEFTERNAVERHGPPPAGEQIGRVSAAILTGGFSELLMAWLDGRIHVTREQLVDDATELFLALGDAAAAIAARRARASKRKAQR